MGEVVWITPAEYASLFSSAAESVTAKCRAGAIPGAEKDPKNGYFWRIPIEVKAYEVLTGRS